PLYIRGSDVQTGIPRAAAQGRKPIRYRAALASSGRAARNIHVPTPGATHDSPHLPLARDTQGLVPGRAAGDAADDVLGLRPALHAAVLAVDPGVLPVRSRRRADRGVAIRLPRQSRRLAGE